MLKKTLLLIMLLPCLFNLNAQVKNNVKLVIEAGPLLLSGDSENLEFFINVEPKVKVLENTFIGLRFGLALNSHKFETFNSFQFNIDENFDNGVVSFVPTLDYYLNDFYLNEKHFRPYLGLGLGYYLSSDVDVSRVDMVNPSEEAFEVRVDNRVGVLFRGGFELNKLRACLKL